MKQAPKLGLVCVHALVTLTAMATAQEAETLCVDCLSIRVGPPTVVRGPFPDELDAAFSAIRLPNGQFRGFTANGATYAVDGTSLADMGGVRRQVLDVGAPGSVNDCGRWLTSTLRAGEQLIGFVHQERACDYDRGQTDKSMAIAISRDDGLHWDELGTVITGTDTARPETITGEGDCSLVDGHDGFYYAYCLRNSDWQTIVARTPTSDLLNWRKYHEGVWREPGLGGAATDIGFVGTGAGFLQPFGAVAAVATDPWFGGLRLSLSVDKVDFVDLDEPLMIIDGAEWARPADTDLSVYATVLNPDQGGNTVDGTFVLAYIYVPAGTGFESRYLVQRTISLKAMPEPQPVQVGVMLTRWKDRQANRYLSSSGPLAGSLPGFRPDRDVAHVLTRAPIDTESVKIVECDDPSSGSVNAMLGEDGSCEALGYQQGRSVGWLFRSVQPQTVPVYQCRPVSGEGHFVSGQLDCEGTGELTGLLGYGFEP